MVVLLTCKNEEDTIKDECAKVQYPNFKSIGIFPAGQGQLIAQSVIESDQISKYVFLWLASKPTRMKKMIQLKTKPLRC